MKKYILLIIWLFFSVLLQAQRQLDIQGNPSSIDTVATIKVNHSGTANVVGLAVESLPASGHGIGGSFYGGFRGLQTYSDSGIGLRAISTAGMGIYGSSYSNYGIYGLSQTHTGAYFKGEGGIAIELGGSDSDYEIGEDDGVIRTQADQIHGDLILVSNDEITFHLDDDDNSGGHLSVFNSDDSNIFSLDESGELTLKQLKIEGDSTTSDTLARILANYFAPKEVVGLAVHSYPTRLDSIFFELLGVAGYFDGGRIGVVGKSLLGSGVRGESNYGWGVSGESISDYCFYGYSQNSTGAYFDGDGGIALELGGANSVYGEANDDAVLRSQEDQVDGDLVLVSNDVIAFHLDDDNNTSGSVLEVRNGVNSQILKLDESGNLTIAGTYSPSSDINRKEKMTPVDFDEILNKVTLLPITEWQFKGEEIRHIGPMAQDFSAAFGLGANNTTIATVDADGVVMAAIQALVKENNSIRLDNEELRSLVVDLAERLTRLEKREGW